MLAKYFYIIRNYVLSVSSQRKYNCCHQNKLLDAFRTSSRNIIGRNPSMVIPLLANQDLTPMLLGTDYTTWILAGNVTAVGGNILYGKYPTLPLQETAESFVLASSMAIMHKK